jgi:transcriptional regulator with XRE-family HTH domain
MSIEIGGRLRSLRKARGLSQEAVARQTNIGLKAYGDLERGRTTDPHYSTLEGIASALGTTVAELVGEESEISAAGKASASRESGQPEGTSAGQWPKSVAEVRAKYLPAAALLGDYVRVYEKLMGTAELTASDVTASVRTAVEANDYHLMLLESEIVELGYVLGRKLTRQEQLHDLSVIQPALAHYRSLIRALVESLPASEEKNALVELASEVRG